VRSLHAHGALRSFVSELPAGTRYGVLITGVDPRSSSRRQALKELRMQWQDDVIPCPQHTDEHVQQALAQAMCVHQAAPQAQAAHDMQDFAEWIAQACGLDGDIAGNGLAKAAGGAP
jgi:cellulose biosynthesis protein BcsQ